MTPSKEHTKEPIILIEQMEEVEAGMTFGWQYANVFLDGKKAKLCTYANAKDGYVVCAKCDENGIIIRDGEVVDEITYGEVLIESILIVDEYGTPKGLSIGNLPLPGDRIDLWKPPLWQPQKNSNGS